MNKIRKTAGIICEYNPFHNGHKYQIEETKKATGCEYTVCAMSGSMVQRGDVAIFDKWTRCRGALEGGADLVIELPAYYVLQSAENFARGGVELLSRLGVVDVLSFGSETGDITKLRKIADVISQEPPEFKVALEKLLSRGLGYPSAMQSVLSSEFGLNLEPNDTLAVNYISALNKLQSDIEPFALKRDVSYHSHNTSDNPIASATAVRELVYSGQDISPFVPVNFDADVYDIRNAESLVLGFFRLCSPEGLKDIIGMETGLENRLVSCAREASSFEEFVSLAVTKRYTAHRIRRVILASLLGMTCGKKCDYVRILGFNSKGRELLADIKAKSTLDIVTKTGGFVPGENSIFNYDLAATDIASLCCGNSAKRIAGQDFVTSPVII